MKKKISQIVAYLALGVVAVAVLLCAVIKINFKPKVAVPVYDVNSGITIEKVDGDVQGGLLQNEKEHNEFVKKYNNSFKLTVLYSIFSGKIGSETQVKTDLTSKSEAKGYEVKFNFVEPQTFEYEDETIEYIRVYFSVEADKGLEEKTIWLETEDGEYAKVITIANFNDLANYIAELNMFAK